MPIAPFQIPITQNMILFSGTIRFTGIISGTDSVKLHIHKNGGMIPVFIITLNAGENTKTNNTNSVDFSTGDTYYAELVTIGNPGDGTFTATIAFY